MVDLKDQFIQNNFINIVGARENNLKNISLQIPKNKLIVITGVSGSGKSSLAFNTIFNEGQRRYMESFSLYARQFIGKMERPDVDAITGLSPVISIEQKTTNNNPRSTVGTVTEIYDFLRLLFAKVATAYSFNTGKPMVKFSIEDIIHSILHLFNNKSIVILAPLIRGRKGHYRELFEDIRRKGFLKIRVDGDIIDLKPSFQVDRFKIHNIEIVIDKITVKEDIIPRIEDSLQTAFKYGEGSVIILDTDTNNAQFFSKNLVCADTGISYEDPSPNTFSFNSNIGHCKTCKGLGYQNQISLHKIIPDKSKSIQQGGIVPIGVERDTSTYTDFAKVAKKKGIDLKIPIDKIPPEKLDYLLFGVYKNLENLLDFFKKESTEIIPKEKAFSGLIGKILSILSTPKNYPIYLNEWASSYTDSIDCITCNGDKLNNESLHFKIKDKNIAYLSKLDLTQLLQWFNNIETLFNEKENKIVKDVLNEIITRIHFLMNVGLGYLTLHRGIGSLSGGESQRIRLATQIGSTLQGITYILDEPSIGLHQSDNLKLINTLKSLRAAGNTVIVVEHDRDIMLAADYLIDIGPLAGKWGGKIVSAGKPKDLKNINSITAEFLTDRRKIELPNEIRKGNGLSIKLNGATGNNLKNIDIDFPLGKYIAICGVSGSGKSSLINNTLYPIVYNHLNNSFEKPLPYKSVTGIENIDKIINIDQKPIGRTPRSNPATYTGFFTEIRNLFAATKEAKVRGYAVGRFSFNVKEGRCDECEGGGKKIITMGFLPDAEVICQKCRGKRFNRETLEIKYKNKSITDVLDMSIDEAADFFQAIPILYKKIKVLQDVGLGYITIGQSAVTISGGEAQRVKLATELLRKDTSKTLFILDEPTTGLHFQDIQHLLNVLQKLVDKGNTVIVIEHNLDMIKMADHIIELGPHGGQYGGNLLFAGTPAEMIKDKKNITGKYLKPLL